MASTAETAADGHLKPKTSPHTRQVKITYSFSGTKPPIYLAGSFTTPPWEPQEMEFTLKEASEVGEDASTEYDFYRIFQVKEGQWEYKFRIGDADWWALDEEAPISTDELGNRNNLLVVKSERTSFATEHTSVETRTPLPLDETVETELFPIHTAHTNGKKEEQETTANTDLPKPESSGDAELNDSQPREQPSPLPVKLSEPDIIPPQEELTVLKERDRVVPQEVEDKTNLVLPGHENKGGELVGVKKADTGWEENGSHKPATREDQVSPETVDNAEADEEAPEVSREPTTQEDEPSQKAVDIPTIEAAIPELQKETTEDADQVTAHHGPAWLSNDTESHVHASTTAAPIESTENEESDPHSSPEKAGPGEEPKPHTNPEEPVLADKPDASAEESKSTQDQESHPVIEELTLVPEPEPEVASEKPVPAHEPESNDATKEPTLAKEPELHAASEEPALVQAPEQLDTLEEPVPAAEEVAPAQEPTLHTASEEPLVLKEPELHPPTEELAPAPESTSHTTSEEPLHVQEPDAAPKAEELAPGEEPTLNVVVEEPVLEHEPEPEPEPIPTAEELAPAPELPSHTASEEHLLVQEPDAVPTAEGPVLEHEPEPLPTSEETAHVQEPALHIAAEKILPVQEPDLPPTEEELAPVPESTSHTTSEEHIPVQEPDPVPTVEEPVVESTSHAAPEEPLSVQEPDPVPTVGEPVLESTSHAASEEPVILVEPELLPTEEESAPTAEELAPVQEPTLHTAAEELPPTQEPDVLPTGEELAPVPESTPHQTSEEPIPVQASEHESISEDPVLVQAPESQAASEEPVHMQKSEVHATSDEPVVVQAPEPDATPEEPVVVQEPEPHIAPEEPAPAPEPELLAISEEPILSKASEQYSSSKAPVTVQEPEPLTAFDEPLTGPESAAEPHNVEVSAPVPDLVTEETAPEKEPTSESLEDVSKDKEPEHSSEEVLESTEDQPQGESFTGPVETQFVNVDGLPEAHDPTAKAPLSPSFKEQKGNTVTSEDESFPIRPVEEHIDGSTDVYHSHNEPTHTEEPADAKEPNFTEEIPIPFTVVEKVPDIKQPVYGDSTDDQSSLHEIVEKRQADAEPDQVVEPEKLPANEDGMAAEASENLPIPTLIVEKTDEEPRHGDDFGPEGTQAQKLAHEKRAADAEPDEIIVSPEHEGERHEVKDETEAIGNLPEPETPPEVVEHLTPRSGTEPPDMESNAHLPNTNENQESVGQPEESSVELGRIEEDCVKSLGDGKDDGVDASTGSAVPEIVEQNQKEVEVSPGASAPPVDQNAAAEEELVTEVPTTPSASKGASLEDGDEKTHMNNESSDGLSVGEIALGATGLAGAAALVRHAVTKPGESAQKSTDLNPAEKEDLSDAPKADEEPNGTESATKEETSGVPDVVRDSISEAHSEPKATAGPEAVHAKEAVEQELLEEVEPVEELGEPAPTITGPLIESAPAPLQEAVTTETEIPDAPTQVDKGEDLAVEAATEPDVLVGSETGVVDQTPSTPVLESVAGSADPVDKPSTPIPEIAETAETAAEVADSAAFIDKPSTPIPEIAETAAEVADSAALLGQPSTPIPEIVEKAETAVEVAESAALLDKPSTPIPEIAETAAEVADSAALLDKPSTPTPEIAETTAEVADSVALLDKPSTPIPKIAETAAEVADSAALLDQPSTSSSGARAIASWNAFGAAVGHNAEFDSPRVEDAPLFAHEYLEPCEEQPTAPGDQSNPSPVLGNETPHEPEEPTADDLADPMLEPFPSEREHVLERLRSTEARLEEDETLVEGIPPSPVLNPSKQLHDYATRQSPSPLLERSPLLDAIPEESAPSSTSKSTLLPEAAEEKPDNSDFTVPIVAAGTAAAGVTGAAIAHESRDKSDKDSLDHFEPSSSVNAAVPAAPLPVEKELPVGTTIDVHERSLTPPPVMEQPTDGVQDIPTADSAVPTSSSTVVHPPTLTDEKSLEPPPTSIPSQAAPSPVELKEVDKALEDADLMRSPSDTKDQPEGKDDSDYQVPSVENVEVQEPPVPPVEPEEADKALEGAEVEPSPSTDTKEPLEGKGDLNHQAPSIKEAEDQEPHAALEEATDDPDHQVPSIETVEVQEPSVPSVEPEEVSKALEEADLEPTPAHTKDQLEVKDDLDYQASSIKAVGDEEPSVPSKDDETEPHTASEQPVPVHEPESHATPEEPKAVQEPEPLAKSEELASVKQPQSHAEEPPLSGHEQSQETHDQEVTAPVVSMEDATREATQEPESVAPKEDGISGKEIAGAVAGVGALVGGAALVGGGAFADVSSEKGTASNSGLEGTSKAVEGPGDGDSETVPHGKSVAKDIREENGAACTIPAVATAPSSDNTSIPPVSSLGDTVGEGSSAKQGKANGTNVSVEAPAEGGLRQRKVAPDTPERPRTPHSVQSLKGPKHTNIFKNFWYTVFGGWVGGFFSKIFGKRNRA